ncbi:CHAT domain-containing protein [Bradyrhizobium sp. WSM1253]|uniref:CHAT domain-containing protein n=1 Tax=Bradyrhizobium sp. WSM1253 TaxID=319003 RepID=UPI00025D1093|nr:CHAT domain-containing protein [Bradyrhizobium sp. WSM1253]EIG63565.1 hypothetical protein Bra1253DRAFT_00051 [Bradyrhizobium sp. WSM1253]
MKWPDSIDLNAITPVAFRKRLKRRLTNPIPHNELIVLYNRIMKLARDKPTAAGSFADAAVSIFKHRREPDREALFLELSARSWMQAGELKPALEATKAFVALARTERHFRDLVELTDDLCDAALSDDRPEELAPKVLAVATAVYAKANQPEKQVNAYLRAAGLFASHGAIQAAYRAANDAEDIARRVGSISLLARVLQQAAIIAYEEKDFEWSANTGRQALDAYAALDEHPPAALRTNTATAMMNTGEHKEALDNLEAVLPTLTAGDRLVQFQVYVNMAVCRRNLSDLPGAKGALIQARANAAPDDPPEARLELELVEARVLAEAADLPATSAALGRAVTCLDELLASLNRLHYRRGVRERYISRFEWLLQTLTEEGPVDAVLSPIAAIYGGVIADWMSALDWGAAVALDRSLPVAMASSIPGLLREIAKQGAPFLYGYREKYDDPWELTLDGQPWDRFGELAAQLRLAGALPPFAMATATAQAELLRERLAQGYCITAYTFAGGAALWVLTERSYKRFRFDFDELKTFVVTRTRFEAGNVDRDTFIAALRGLRDRFLPELTPIFDDLVASGSPGILHLQDALNAMPITMLAAEHDHLGEAMRAGKFEVRVIPAIYPRSTDEPLKSPHISVIRDDADDLLLARYEAQVACSAIEASRVAIFAPNDVDGLLNDMTKTDVLVVSTHGSAISRFTDPNFGSLGAEPGEHSISVNRIQTEFPWFPYRLAVLNACHAGSGSARNYQRQFRTHDVASYPALLLLNRRSVVGAAAWRTSDTASYIHLALTTKGLAEGLTPSRAFSRATARLRNLSKTETLELLNLVPDPGARATAVQRIAAAPAAGMFSEPYLYAGFEVYVV